MTDSLTSKDRAEITALVAALEAAWNAGDGAAFATPMTDDADFVTIRAEHFRGRQAIAAGHAAIFRTIYAGSTNRLAIESMRMLWSDVALVHVAAELAVPAGPLAGRHKAMFSAVLLRSGGEWRIASFHNTLAPPEAGQGGGPPR